MSDTVLQNKAELTLDPGDFEGNSRKVVDALKQIQAAAQAAQGPLTRVGTATATASTNLGNAARQTHQLRTAMASLTGAVSGSAAATGTLGNRLTRLGTATRANTTALGANTSAINANNASITGLGTHIASLQTSVDQLSQHMQAAAANTTRLGQAAGTASTGFGMFARVAAALSFGVLAKEAVQLTDAYRSLQQRLTVTTAGIASSGGAMADVSRIAKDTRANLDDIGLLYAKVANAGKHFGATQSEVGRVTETVSKGLRIFGASAAETSSTITQLGQALASGRLQGDEFRSMTENAPALMDILAKSTGKPRAELKKLGTEGKLTSDIIIRAFGTQSEAIKELDANFLKLPVTVSESFTLVKNSIEETLGTSESMVGVTRVLSAALQALANNMGAVIPIVTTLSIAIGVNMVRNMVLARIAAGSLGTALLGALANSAISLGITAIIGGLAILGTQIYESNRQTNALADASNKAATGTKLTGVESLMAARGVASFGSQVGEAAGKLWEMAKAARAAAIETAKLNFQKASTAYHDQVALTDRGFNQAQADINNRVTDPNASFGERVTAIGSAVSLGGKKLFAPRQSVVVAARDTAFTRMQEASTNLREATTGTMESYIPSIDPAVTKPDKKKPKSKSDPVGDFWKGMEQAKTLAGLTGIEVESMTKQFELQNAAHRKLSDAEVKRIDTLLAQTRAAKLLSDILDKSVDLRIANASAETALWSKANGATEDQLSVEKSLSDFRDRAIKDRISTESDLYKAREAEYKTELQRANDLKSIQRGLDYAATVSPDIQNRNSQTALTNRRTDLESAYNAPNTTLTERDYKLGLRGIENDQRKLNNTFYSSMAESISGVADLFGEKMGGKIDKLGKVLDAIVKAASGDMSGFGAAGKALGMFTKRKDGTPTALGDQMTDAMSNQLSGLGKALGIGNRKTDKVAAASDTTALNTDEIVVQGRKLPSQLASTLTSALIGAGIGGAIGGTAGSIGGALGGAAMQEFAGKALGAFAGPLGGIVGGIAGSVLGGLFKTEKNGSSTLMIGADGQAYGSDAVGKGSDAKKAAQQLSGSLAGQLNDLATTLGATLGNASVSIGYRPGHKDPAYRVDTSGSGKVTGVQAFESEAEAIAYALKDAINDGVLVGLSDFAQKAINSLDIDAAVSLVGAFKNITDELDAMNDPIGAAVRSVNSDLNSLVSQMNKVGANGTDLAKVEELRSKKLAQIMEDNLSSIRDFQKYLNGEAGGVTLAAQLANAQATFAGFKTDIAAGKTVDQEKFTAAGQEVNSLASSLYGSATPFYQSIKDDLSKTTMALVANVTNAVNGAAGITAISPAVDPATTAVTDQTATLAKIGNTTNDLLAANNALLMKLVANGGYQYEPSAGATSVNGKVQLV
ncbi:tape measure protein [Sphingomonas aurantiaca]|uniref:tape measure protein n=1 Tax=Sphingomonas aurantiaca TaxID=185949 RepID=UPI002FDFF315